MNTITFPGLGIELVISKIAFEICGIQIKWYAILIVSAIIIALIIFKKRSGLYSIMSKDILDLSLFLLPASFLGARLYYVIFNLDYFLKNPLQILNIRQGGLAIFGGIIAGFIVCFAFAKKRKINIKDLTDYIVPALALRTSNRKMGQFYKCWSIRIWNHKFF